MKYLGVVVMLVVCAGCTAHPPQKSGIMQTVKADIRVSAAELRIQVRGLADQISGRIEASADQIRQEATDRTVRRNALLWKLNAIPNFQAATFLPDPAGALVETWALAIQMRLLFKSENGGTLLGGWTETAVSTSMGIETLCTELIQTVISPEDFSRSREVVEGWALRHPIPNLSFQMDSIYPQMKLGAVRSGFEGLSIPQTVSTMSEQIEDVQYYLALFNKHLPSRIRWQVDLLTDELLGDVATDQALASFSSVSKSFADIAPVIQQTPELVAEERSAVFQSIAEERRTTLEEVERIAERREDFVRSAQSDIQAFAEAQRIAMTRDFTRERVETLKAADALVAAIAGDVQTQRELMTKDFQRTSHQLLEESTVRGEALVDRVFLWLAGVLGGFLVLGFVGGWILIRIARPS